MGDLRGTLGFQKYPNDVSDGAPTASLFPRTRAKPSSDRQTDSSKDSGRRVCPGRRSDARDRRHRAWQARGPGKPPLPARPPPRAPHAHLEPQHPRLSHYPFARHGISRPGIAIGKREPQRTKGTTPDNAPRVLALNAVTSGHSRRWNDESGEKKREEKIHTNVLLSVL